MPASRGSVVAVLVLASTTAVASAGAAERPHLEVPQLQYGFGFFTALVANNGSLCSADDLAPCILGGGFGLALRVGVRPQRRFYAGGSYEVSRHSSANLLRLPILQRLSGEVRYFFDQERRSTPFIAASLGAAAYGDEWGADAWGGTAGLSIGIEHELDAAMVVGARLGYRPLAFAAWTDRAGEPRGAGPVAITHLLELEVQLEPRARLSRR